MKNKFLLITLLFFIQFSTAQWVEQNIGQTNNLTSISAINDNITWVASTFRYIYRSTNGGTSWSTVYNSNDGTYIIYCIYAISTDTALFSVGSGGSMIKRTIDGGINWSTVQSFSSNRIRSIFMLSPNGIFIGDYPNATRWSIYKTNNSGNTWDSSGLFLAKLSDEITFNNSMAVIGSNIWFASNKNKIYHSTDFGTTWQIQNPYWNSSNTMSNRFVWFNNLNNGITNVENQFSYTTNGGNNWLPMQQQLSEAIVSGITGTGMKYWCSIDKKIYSTTNTGTNWVLEYTSPDAYFYNYFSKSRVGTCAWATRNNGGLSKGTNITGISSIITEVPASYNLYQNYPNPFNPSTKIRFAVASNVKREMSNVKLVIFDILGKEISTLVNEKLKPGEYEVEWNASDYPSGVYFYRLITDGFSDTKKMTLVK
ncbi:MAG: T9SS C-terminal target domain-containing protein [Ignavibacteriae bacterium]|nr:MAG: T9SS C-terminal target domain-containing protein [Ignavibacteriota bacterium]